MTEFEEVIGSMVELEGFTFEEAKLTYARREKLPASVFCGPNRTYPVPDAAHARNALARLSQFGNRLSPATRARILACVKRKAKEFGVEISETIEGKLCIAKFDETASIEQRTKLQQEIDAAVSWFLQKNKR